MSFEVHDGFPDLASHASLVASQQFADMDTFSCNFLTRHRQGMGYYRLRWGGNPLRNWSRQWEYPFVFESISKYAARKSGPLKILDAGSGVTFFPWLLQARLEQAEVSCCDYDARLAAIYDGINGREYAPVAFSRADMAHLPYQDASFDVIYCISVLEHTRNYPEIVSEFQRVLKPGGLLVLTFDVSIDGMHEISLEDSDALLDVVGARFVPARAYRATAEYRPQGLLTTGTAGKAPAG
jgi:SAM-dependent methyltransferase